MIPRTLAALRTLLSYGWGFVLTEEAWDWPLPYVPIAMEPILDLMTCEQEQEQSTSHPKCKCLTPAPCYGPVQWHSLKHSIQGSR
jgi:hypothetical protein